MNDLTTEGRAALAAHLIDVPWAVYLRGIHQIISCPQLCPGTHTCVAAGPDFTREAAFGFAASVGRTASASGEDSAREVEVEPVVLHYGIPWTDQTADGQTSDH